MYDEIYIDNEGRWHLDIPYTREMSYHFTFFTFRISDYELITGKTVNKDFKIHNDFISIEVSDLKFRKFHNNYRVTLRLIEKFKDK